MAVLLRLCLVVAVLTLVRPASGQTLMVAVDHSMSAAEYAALGMPLPTRAWRDEELRHAVAVLQQLASQDPLRLPRLGSAASGAVFARLVAPVTLAQDATGATDARAQIAELSGYAQPLGALALLYAKPLAGDFFFDAELVESTRVALDVNRRLLQLINRERTQHEDRAAPEWLRQAHNQVAYGAGLTLRGALFIFSARRAFRPEWRARLATDLQREVPAVMAQLPESAHAEILTHLHGLMLEDLPGYSDWQPLQQVMTFVGHGPPAFAKPRPAHKARRKKK